MHFDWQMLVQLLISALCGAALGIDRELHRKPAGLRTNMLIALGSTLFTYCSVAIVTEGVQRGDPARIAAQIVTGVGFIGAGTIMRQQDQITGLTSAATVFVVAAIGVLVGAGRSLMAVCATGLALLILHGMVRLECWILKIVVDCQADLLVEDREGIMTDIRTFLRQRGVPVHAMECKPAGDDGRLAVTIRYYARRKQHARLRQPLGQIQGVLEAKARVL